MKDFEMVNCWDGNKNVNVMMVTHEYHKAKIAELEKIIELLFNCCYEIDDHSQREYNTNYIKALALKESKDA